MSIQKHKYEYPYETKINLLRDSIVPLRLTQPSPFYCRPIICPLGQYISELYDWFLRRSADTDESTPPDKPTKTFFLMRLFLIIPQQTLFIQSSCLV
jgi:hypothetical protein